MLNKVLENSINSKRPVLSKNERYGKTGRRLMGSDRKSQKKIWSRLRMEKLWFNTDQGFFGAEMTYPARRALTKSIIGV